MDQGNNLSAVNYSFCKKNDKTEYELKNKILKLFNEKLKMYI